MKLNSWPDVPSFFDKVRSALELEEGLNSRILGLCLHALKRPSVSNPYLVTLEQDGIIGLTALMLKPGKLILSGSFAEPELLQALADDLNQSSLLVNFLNGHQASAEYLVPILTRHSGLQYELLQRHCFHELTQLEPIQLPEGLFRQADMADLDLIIGWVLDFYKTSLPTETPPADPRSVIGPSLADGDYFLWETDGQARAMVAKMRPCTTGITLGWVYAPPEARGQGHATSVTAHMTQHLLESGWRLCWLFTDIANPVSNHIYQKLGYRPVSMFDFYGRVP